VPEAHQEDDGEYARHQSECRDSHHVSQSNLGLLAEAGHNPGHRGAVDGNIGGVAASVALARN